MMRILVVDDEPLITRVIARLLVDHDVHVARDVTTALEIYRRRLPFDAAIIDYHLGHVLGTALAAQLIVDGVHVVVTGGDLPEGLPFTTLDKPFQSADLVAALENPSKKV